MERTFKVDIAKMTILINGDKKLIYWGGDSNKYSILSQNRESVTFEVRALHSAIYIFKKITGAI